VGRDFVGRYGRVGPDTSLVSHGMYYYYGLMFMPLRLVKMGKLGLMFMFMS